MPLRAFNLVKNALGSKRLAMVLLKAACVYLAFVTIVWIRGHIPPPIVIITPVAAWGVLFLVNLAISIMTGRYHYWGNIVFHAAFLIIALGVLMSMLYRFEGSTFLAEKDSFFGDRSEYFYHNAETDFDKLAPTFSLMLDDVSVEFWKDKLYFTGYVATMLEPATTRERALKLWLNGGARTGGARLSVTEYAMYPELLIRRENKTIVRGLVRSSLFPPGKEHVMDFGDYKYVLALYPDPVVDEAGVRTLSMNITEPVLVLKVEWLGKLLAYYILNEGEEVAIGRTKFKFEGVREVAGISVIKDPGEMVIFAGFIMGLAGLVMRLLRMQRRRKHEVPLD